MNWTDFERKEGEHQKPRDITYAYGTAGFRADARSLNSVMFRMGLLASLRSQSLGGKCVGVMVTASHNPPRDNGVKLVDPMGDMLASDWEPIAQTVANAASAQELQSLCLELVSERKIDTRKTPHVIYARDSRESGPELIGCLADGLRVKKALFEDFNLLTTPQLHYIVRCLNCNLPTNYFGQPSEKGYFDKLIQAYQRVTRSAYWSPVQVTVDAANGIGAPKLDTLNRRLQGVVRFEVVNGKVDVPEELNHQCGADYVKTNQRAPPSIELDPTNLYASFDGDADRIVFYYLKVGQNGEREFRLLDGDKIAALISGFLADLLRQGGKGLTFGVVQTAYANGNSTQYMAKTLSLPYVCAKTGVKHLHHTALKFDVGVYYEANGHGTVLFDQRKLAELHDHEPASRAVHEAVETLTAMCDLLNQCVGDAISNLMAVLAVLKLKKWTVSDWDACYEDLPNKLVKVAVSDRSVFRTTDAERRLVSPEHVQKGIDDIVSRVPQGRSFVRASGTEDCVRVYAEAASSDNVEKIISHVTDLLEKL